MLTNQAKLHQLLKKDNPSNHQRQEILKILRNGKYDLPDCVFQNAFKLLKNNSSGNQRFYNANDLILSGLQINVGGTIKGYLLKFKKALGEVPYIQKLMSLITFTTSEQPDSGHFAQAINEDRTNYDSRKQAIASHKVVYEWGDYVAGLNKYLQENPNDAEAWMELGDLYTQKSQYLRATFCYEQVVILSPQNDYYFMKLAELYYTDGGKTNLSTASKYYSYVISRNPQNPRALWGLYRTLLALKDNIQQQDKQLLSKVGDSINKLYSKKNPNIKIHLAL